MGLDFLVGPSVLIPRMDTEVLVEHVLQELPREPDLVFGFCLFQISSQCDPKKDTILFIDPGFPVQRQQVRILGIKHESFDIYDFRAEKLGPKLESYLKQGNVAAIIYSLLVPLGELLVAPADASRLLERLQGTFDAGFARVRLGHQGLHGGPCAAPVGLAAVGQGDEHESGRGRGCGRLPERP